MMECRKLKRYGIHENCRAVFRFSAYIGIFILIMIPAMVCKAEKPKETRTIDKTETEKGIAVRIVDSRGGEERVLMDYEYDAAQFPYYFNRYTDVYDSDDVFYQFYSDDFCWVKTIHTEDSDKRFTLYYAQNIRYDGEDKEKATGYEGHLWVTDENTEIVKRQFWQSQAPYTKITWKNPGFL